jgi:hypothetical protein
LVIENSSSDFDSTEFSLNSSGSAMSQPGASTDGGNEQGVQVWASLPSHNFQYNRIFLVYRQSSWAVCCQAFYRCFSAAEMMKVSKHFSIRPFQINWHKLDAMMKGALWMFPI